ncbi:MAG: formylglycine-generating enzyme family protein [Planctomycetaceae bacterium]
MPFSILKAATRLPLCWLVLVSTASLCRGLRADAPASDVAVDSSATTQVEMKPYSEPLKHTGVTIEMVPIRGGTFMMGSPASEPDRKDDEGPQHEVTVDPFWMGKYEVTWDQYDTWGERIDIIRRDLAGLKPTPQEIIVDGMTRPTEPYTDMSFGFGKGNYPAICMTQHAARSFCKWLSAKTGHYYRLPTEAEWEYAARAGTTSMYSFGNDPEQLDDYAVWIGNSNDQYEEVGTKKPNPWGLYDMHGNVAEWVLDQYVPDIYQHRAGSPVANPLVVPKTLYPHSVRGGGWDDDSDMLRSAAREGSSEEWKQQDPQLPQSIWYFTDALGVGFRVVRPLVEPSEADKNVKWEKCDPPQLDPVEGE